MVLKVFNWEIISFNGLSGVAFCLKFKIPLISISAKSISLLPSSWRSIFRMQNSLNPWELTCWRSLQGSSDFSWLLAPSISDFVYLGCGRFSSSSKLSYDDQESLEHPDNLLPLPRAKILILFSAPSVGHHWTLETKNAYTKLLSNIQQCNLRFPWD